jgi:hypothetical protein
MSEYAMVSKSSLKLKGETLCFGRYGRYNSIIIIFKVCECLYIIFLFLGVESDIKKKKKKKDKDREKEKDKVM